MASRHPRLRALTAFVVILMCVGALVVAIAPGARANSIATAPVTDASGWSATAWAKREAALRTNEQAELFARDLGQAYQASIPLPSPGFFVEQVQILTLRRLRGTDQTSVWLANFAVTVKSSEVESYSTSFLQQTKFGPGIRPGDTQLVGVQNIFAFADMQPFSTTMRTSFLDYLLAHGNPKPVRIALLNQPFPGAPWYEDTSLRRGLLALGAAKSMGPGDLAWTTFASGHSQLLGYEAQSHMWIALTK